MNTATKIIEHQKKELAADNKKIDALQNKAVGALASSESEESKAAAMVHAEKKEIHAEKNAVHAEKEEVKSAQHMAAESMTDEQAMMSKEIKDHDKEDKLKKENKKVEKIAANAL